MQLLCLSRGEPSALVNIYIFKPQYLFSILPCLSCQLTQITSLYFNLFLRKLIRSLSWILEDLDKEYQIKSLYFQKVLLFMMKKFIIFLVWRQSIVVLLLTKTEGLELNISSASEFVLLIFLLSDASHPVLRAAQHNFFFNCWK